MGSDPSALMGGLELAFQAIVVVAVLGAGWSFLRGRFGHVIRFAVIAAVAVLALMLIHVITTGALTA